MLPQPMMPRVFPNISTPRNLFFSHLPARVDASASGICRASDSMSVIACSAVVIELPNGVFITMMPRAGAADHLEAFRPFEDFRRYLGRRADGEPVEAVDRLGKLLLVLAETGLKLDLNAAVFEDRDRGGRKRVGDEYSGLHGISCRCQVPRPGSFMRCSRTMS